ncbi:hypothetical protein MNBD_GAMMA09-2703 [hydrothermal vent metagenome]|uniref:Calx-beta domain-containing protein n=1 Tax=hydrothermal vent metagenome TaxID=652676 RepID=A0A3B0YFB0_9ZZZZ
MITFKHFKKPENRSHLTKLAGIMALSALITACSSGSDSTAPGAVAPVPPVSPGTVQFASPTVSVSEGAGSIDITVTRTLGTQGAISVDYSIADGTASGSDYNSANINGTLNWTDADSQPKTISINIVDDLQPEASETINISLSNATNNATLSSNNTTQISIIDNDTFTTITNTLYFYVSETTGTKSIYAYDPENLNLNAGSNQASPSDSILIDSNTEGESIVSSITLSATTPGTGSDIHYPAIIYIKGGKIWKVLSQSATSVKNPIQISSENNAQLCNDESFINEDMQNLDDSLYFYLDAGADRSCNTSDDQWKYIKFGWDNTVNPVLTLNFIGDLSGSTQGTPLFLAWDDVSAGLFKCSTTCTFVSNLNNRPDIIGSIDADNKEYLVIDNTIVIYDSALNTFSNPIFTSQNLFFSPFELADGSTSYFMDGSKIYKLNSSGSAPTLLVDEGNSKSIFFSPFSMTSQRLIYSLTDMTNSRSEIRSILKNGGTSTQLVSSSSPFLPIMGVSGQNIYYNLSRQGTPVAGMIKADGTGKTETINESWTGITVSNTINLTSGIQIYNIFKIDEISKNISVYDASNFTLKKVLGKQPADISDISFVGVDDKARAIGTQQSGSTFGFDMFYTDVSSVTPLIRITNTPAANDGIILY